MRRPGGQVGVHAGYRQGTVKRLRNFPVTRTVKYSAEGKVCELSSTLLYPLSGRLKREKLLCGESQAGTLQDAGRAAEELDWDAQHASGANGK